MRVNAAPVAFFVPKERRHIPPAHIWRGPGSSENQTTNETYPIREEAGFISDVLHDLENFAADPWRGTGFGVETYQGTSGNGQIPHQHTPYVMLGQVQGVCPRWPCVHAANYSGCGLCIVRWNWLAEVTCSLGREKSKCKAQESTRIHCFSIQS